MKTRILKQKALEARALRLQIQLRKKGEKLNKANLAFMIAKEKQYKLAEEYHAISERLAGTNGLISSCVNGSVEVIG